MTQSSSTHGRPPSIPRASKSKSSHPVRHRRGTSGASLQISKLGSGSSRSGSQSRNRDDETELDMAASFLNFCAMCEKQITVPNNSLLYCSESCRRKDSCKPLSASISSMSSVSNMPCTPPTSPYLSPRTIVAPMIPTGVPTNPFPSTQIPMDTNDTKTDLDPTEWKPSILSTKRIPSSASLASDDPWTYFPQFHVGVESLLHRPSQGSTASLPALVSRTNTGNDTLPSLTRTPTVASSVSSTPSDYLCSVNEPPRSSSSSSMQHRPLPPRRSPCFSTSTTTKGEELVVPHIASTTEDNPVEVSDSGSLFPGRSDIWEDRWQ